METASKLQKQLAEAEAKNAREPRGNVMKGKKNLSKTKPAKGTRIDGENEEIQKLISKALMSELMIYKNAVEDQIAKCFSSSSSDSGEDIGPVINTSDELDNLGENTKYVNDSLIEEFIAESRQRQYPGDVQSADMDRHSPAWPETSRQPVPPDGRANQIIRNAEASKARIHEVPGNYDYNDYNGLMFEKVMPPEQVLDFQTDFVHSVMVESACQKQHGA